MIWLLTPTTVIPGEPHPPTPGEFCGLNPDRLKSRGKFQLADAVSNAVAVGPDETTLYVSTAMNHLFVVDRQQANEVARLAH
jgi:sugar lactone lactonase YvrE